MRTWSVTDRGLVRSENQDACAVLTPDGYTVAVVCDGMGGTQGGADGQRHSGGDLHP